MSRFQRPALRLLLLLASALLYVGCDSVNCPLNSNVAAVYKFYDSSGKSFVLADELTVTACGTDSVLMNRLTRANSMSLPLSYYSACDTLLFTLTDADGFSATDTVWIEKQSTPHAEDPSCPIHVWHRINRVRHTSLLIDSIGIVNPTVNFDGSDTFSIYFITE